MTASPILLVTGPVGAGKTTVAKLVVEQWGAPVAYLEGDVFWTFFARPAPAATRLEARRRDGKIVIQAMVASAARFARGGYDVVTDFTVGPWAIAPITEALGDLPLDLVVLYPSLAVCAERAAARSEGRIADYAPYCELHDAFGKLGGYASHALADDGAEPGELAARIHSGLAAGEFRLKPHAREQT